MSTMLSPNSLQPPKTGVSRWSKALPEVPGVDFDDIYGQYEDDELSPVSPENKDLPRLPIAPPPPRSTSMAANVKSLNSSLPSLPPSVDNAAPVMTIPRRPVGKQQPARLMQPQHQQPQQQQWQSQSQLQLQLQPQPEAQSPPSPQQTHSRTQSISSILSAYSKSSSSGDSPMPSSEGTRQSEATNSSPSHPQAPPANTYTNTGSGSSRATDVLITGSSTTEPKLPQTHAHQPQQHVRVAPAPPVKLRTDIPPPPPTKDRKYELVASPASVRSPATVSATASDLNTSSPPRPQIWRRRSVKTKQSIDLPDLQLVDSHGSTAASVASASVPVTQQPVTKKPVAIQAQLTVQSNKPYLPAGVIKVSNPAYQPPRANVSKPEATTATKDLQPAPAHTETPAATLAPPAPIPDRAAESDSPTMGNGGSKLNKLKDKLQILHRRGKSSVDTASDSTGRPGAHRPPTPEYQKQDVKTPIIDSFVSPLSPASSPEPPAEVSPELSKELPKSRQETNSPYGPIQEPGRVLSPNGEAKSPIRKAVPPPANIDTKPIPETTPALAPELPFVAHTELPVSFSDYKLEIVSEIGAPVTEAFPPLPIDVGSRPSSGTDSPASRAIPSTEVASKFPPRGSSVRSFAPRPFEQLPRYPPEDQDPRLVPSESQGYLYRGRDGTLYPEMKVTREFDPQAAYFPKQTEKPAHVDTIYKSVPLKESHYNCYQRHRTMNRRANRNYPLTCQTCEKPDAEDRWVCTFCHLRICESCFTTLNGRQRNLRQLVEGLGHKIPIA